MDVRKPSGLSPLSHGDFTDDKCTDLHNTPSPRRHTRVPLTRSAGCRGPSSRVTSQQSVCGQVVTRCVRCVYRSTCDRSHVTPHPPRPDHAETWTPLPSWAWRAPRGQRAAPCSAPRARCPLVPVLGWTPPTQQEGGISRMQKHGSATGSRICASGNVHGGATEIWPRGRLQGRTPH